MTPTDDDWFGEVQPLAVPFRRDLGNTIRIGKSRITLDLVVEMYDAGSSADEIIYAFDTLNIADVYAVLAYIETHRPQIDRYMAAREEQAKAIKSMIDSDPRNQEMRARLLARKRTMQR